MANSVGIQTTVDGPRNVIVKCTIYADTSDVSSTTLLDPATLSATQPPTNQLRIDEVQYSVQDGWYVNLLWDASSAVHIVDLAGRGFFDLKAFGGWINNAGAGKTGKILVSTTGYSSGTMVATFTLHAIKQTV